MKSCPTAFYTKYARNENISVFYLFWSFKLIVVVKNYGHEIRFACVWD